MYSLQAACWRTLKKPQRELDAAIEALETREIDRDNPKQDSSGAYWSIATLAEFGVGDFDTARTFYGRLMEEYPQDVRRYGAQNALRRMTDLETRLATGETGEAR